MKSQIERSRNSTGMHTTSVTLATDSNQQAKTRVEKVLGHD